MSHVHEPTFMDVNVRFTWWTTVQRRHREMGRRRACASACSVAGSCATLRLRLRECSNRQARSWTP